MITIDEKAVGIWYLVVEQNKVDILGYLSEIEPDKLYRYDYRFRYYVDDKVFQDSADKKSWYRIEMRDRPRNVAIRAVQMMFILFEATGSPDGETYEILNTDGLQNFYERFKEAPFAHSRPATNAEIAELGLDKGREKL